MKSGLFGLLLLGFTTVSIAQQTFTETMGTQPPGSQSTIGAYQAGAVSSNSIQPSSMERSISVRFPCQVGAT